MIGRRRALFLLAGGTMATTSGIKRSYASQKSSSPHPEDSLHDQEQSMPWGERCRQIVLTNFGQTSPHDLLHRKAQSQTFKVLRSRRSNYFAVLAELDYESGKMLEIDGWLLSETEVFVAAALYEKDKLWHTPG